MNNNVPSISQSVSNMNAWSGGKIAPVANLANRKIFLQVGTSDTTVGVNPMKQLKAQMDNFADASKMTFVTNNGVAHTFPTDFDATGNNACSSGVSPYISNCGYDGAGAVLKWMYGSLAPRNTGTPTGSVISFDQTGSYGSLGLDSTAYLYVPRACQDGSVTCKLHVALHGCLQSASKIGTKFVENTGFNKWAGTYYAPSRLPLYAGAADRVVILLQTPTTSSSSTLRPRSTTSTGIRGVGGFYPTPMRATTGWAGTAITLTREEVSRACLSPWKLSAFLSHALIDGGSFQVFKWLPL
jgi:hypothetical protein